MRRFMLTGDSPSFAISILTSRPQRTLLKQLVRREISARYRGSWLGLGWSFVTPLLMLGIYTFVFGVIFKARWNFIEPENKIDLALSIFSGLIVFNLLSDVVSRAPGLVTANPNYVKKVVFPLELLPLVALGAALFHAFASIAVLLVTLIFTDRLSLWILIIPVVIVPFSFFVLGLGWLLAALGVYLRDIGQVISTALSALLLLSPVFYPVSAFPAAFQPWLFFNPLTVPIEAMRALLIDCHAPDWVALMQFSGVSLVTAWLGFRWFDKFKRGFADVL